MTTLMLRCILNRTLVVSVHKKRLLPNLSNARRMLFTEFCKEVSRSVGEGFVIVNRVKWFSCCSVNCVKFFAEKENDYAHMVMESSAGYSERLYRRSAEECKTVSDEKYKELIDADWSSSSSLQLLSAFKDVTSYCAARCKDMTVPELSALCLALADKCGELNDQELVSCLECLTYWPQAESLNSPNFVEMWSALDRACVARAKHWDHSTLLYVADVWYTLHLARVCKYVAECIWRLARKLKHLSPQQLVQCLFYMNCRRHFNIPCSMYEFEFYVEQCVHALSVDELSIVAMGFFKSETPIRSSRILSCMMEKTREAIDDVNEVSLCSLMKLFRYCVPLRLVDNLYELLDKTVSSIGRLSMFCCVQIALVGTPTQLFHEQTVAAVARRVLEELSTARLKDIERMIFVLTLFDYVPECAPDFFEKVTAEIQNRTASTEVRQYPKNLAYCLNYLSVREIYPEDLVNKVLSQEFIEETYSNKNLHMLGRELLCLDVGVEIDCPDYKGNRLDSRARRYLAKRFTKWFPDRTKKSLSTTERLLVETLEAAEEVIGKENVYADIISPNYTLPDIVLGVDVSGKGIPVANLFSRYHVEDVKYPVSRFDGDKWFCLVAGGINMFVRNQNFPLGSTKTRLRHLSRIGYHPILVPWFEFTKLAASEKPEYIRQKIFQIT